MLELFEFDLPGQVTRQVQERLRSMVGSPLTRESLRGLADFQRLHGLCEGVYELILKEEVVYVWKAKDLRSRLEQDYQKLMGRQGIAMADLRFRSLMMHSNWATVTDLDSLIAHYKSQGWAKWNGSPFGPKDAGRNRDGTEPSWFDREHPINAEFGCMDIPDHTTVGDLVRRLKDQLPFTFRYEVSKTDGAKVLDLAGVPRNARALLRAALKALGVGWQAMIFFSHVILYQERRAYEHGQPLCSAD